MLDQNQISAMMAQQQQQQQMLSMGSPSAVMGASHYPPQYNFGTDTGLIQNRLSGGGGLPGMAASGVSALGAGLGTLGSAASLGSMFGIGGATVGGTAGMLMGLNPLSLGLMAASAPATMLGGGMMHGNRVNASVGNMLSSSGFANPTAPNGFGFGFNDQTRMSQQMIGMGAANPFVSTQDQQQLLGKFQQMGLDKGLTSMDKMMDKFKEFSEMTEEVAVSLGKTVGEVTGVVNQLKGQGFYSASEVTGMNNRIAAGANYGLDFNQQMQMTQSMANVARGQGLSGQAGAMVSTNLAQGFGAAFSMNNVNSNLAMDITGTTNTADAAMSLGQKFGSTMMTQFNRGGRLSPFLSGMVKEDKSGNVVLDQEAISAAASGTLSVDDIKSRGQNVLKDARLKAKFTNNQEQLTSDLMKTNEGSTAAFGLLKGIASQEAGRKGMDEDDVFVNLMRTFGMANERESRLLYDYIEDLEETSSKRLMDEANYASAQKRRALLTREKSVAALKRKFGHEVSKFTSNPMIARGFVKASNNFSSSLNRMERSLLGIDVPSSALFTEGAVGDVLARMSSGDLDTAALGVSARGLQNDMFGNASMGHRTKVAAGAQGLSYDKFGAMLQKGVDLSGKGTIDSGLLNNFYDETGNRDGTFVTTNTGRTLGAAGGIAAGYGVTGALAKGLGTFGGFKGKLAAGALIMGAGVLGGSLAGGDDEQRVYKQLMQDAKAKGATSEQEAHAMIAQTPEGSSALRSYMQKHGSGESFDLVSSAKSEYLATARESEGMSYASIGSAAGGVIGGALGLVTGATAGAAAGGIGFVPGAAVGTVKGASIGSTIGAALGATADMFFGDGALRDLSESGAGAKVLSKLGSKEQLQNLDKLYKDAYLNTRDHNKARVEVAKVLSDKLGEDITGTDIQVAMSELKGATGQSYDERINGGDYAKALDLAEKAKTFQDITIAKEHMSEVGASLTGEGDPMVSAIREAALLGDSKSMMTAMRKLSGASISGDFSYEGDNEFLQKLTGSGKIFEQLRGLEGKDVSALDDIFGQKGIGKKLRSSAGVMKSGSLTERELREISNIQASLDAYGTQTAGAAQGMASSGLGAAGDTERLATATKKLVQSTEDLASYVDNIGANLFNKEPVGTGLPT